MTFVTIRCGGCGVEFGVPDYFDDDKRETGDPFFCPNGHSRVYKERRSDCLQRDLDRAKQENARLAEEATASRKAAEESDRKCKRIEKRIHAGVCPACNRSFADVARHMKTKHSPKCEVVTLKAVS